MKLRVRIQRSMFLVIAITIVAAYAITTFVVYRQTVGLVEDEIRQESDYIKAAVEISGTSYLKELDQVQENTRVTLIDADGKVLYDSTQDEATLENHKDRPEVADAIENGTGTDVRMSATLSTSMYYYAVRLSDGNVLRVAKSMNSIFRTAIQVLPAMIIIAILMLILAYLLSRWQVKRLIRPINDLDLEHPLENDVYEELTPLLQSMEEQNQEKEAVANMRQEFSANVSHELKTPLTSISGYAEIMRDGLVKPEDMSGFADRIYQEASRLILLVEDIMKLSKLDEGDEDMPREEVDLYELTSQIVGRLEPLAKEQQVEITLDGTSVKYTGILQVLDQMIYNLCENAIKYNKPGGYVKVHVADNTEGPKITVEDNGIGIPQEELERIFERFYRVDKSHSKETGGTGLGLSIVKHGAMIHDAKIKVESSLGEGTKMEIQFLGT